MQSYFGAYRSPLAGFKGDGRGNGAVAARCGDCVARHAHDSGMVTSEGLASSWPSKLKAPWRDVLLALLPGASFLEEGGIGLE